MFDIYFKNTPLPCDPALLAASGLLAAITHKLTVDCVARAEKVIELNRFM